jgi:hypothetical protein
VKLATLDLLEFSSHDKKTSAGITLLQPDLGDPAPMRSIGFLEFDTACILGKHTKAENSPA